MTTQATDFLWDISIYAVGTRICLLALSVRGIIFVDAHRYLGESFGNGLILEEEAAGIAVDNLDDQNLKTKTMF